MRLEFGDLVVRSDAQCWQVLRKTEVKAGPKTRPENVGTIREDVLAYPATLAQALRCVRRLMLREDPRCLTIDQVADRLDELEGQAQEMLDAAQLEIATLRREVRQLKSGEAADAGA